MSAERSNNQERFEQMVDEAAKVHYEAVTGLPWEVPDTPGESLQEKQNIGRQIVREMFIAAGVPELLDEPRAEPKSSLRMRASLDGECPVCFRSDLVALSPEQREALLWASDGLSCMWTGRGECPHCAQRRKDYLSACEVLEAGLS